jgi:hypothetical protein
MQNRALINIKMVVPMHLARMLESKSAQIVKRERRIISYITLTRPNGRWKKNMSVHRRESV